MRSLSLPSTSPSASGVFSLRSPGHRTSSRGSSHFHSREVRPPKVNADHTVCLIEQVKLFQPFGTSHTQRLSSSLSSPWSGSGTDTVGTEGATTGDVDVGLLAVGNDVDRTGDWERANGAAVSRGGEKSKGACAPCSMRAGTIKISLYSNVNEGGTYCFLGSSRITGGGAEDCLIADRERRG
jgi:hypothetical protein